MARVDTPSYMDDLTTVAAITLAEGDVKPSKLSDKGRVQIRLTQGEHTYTVDTDQSNPVAALLRSTGVKQGKKGAKPKGAEVEPVAEPAAA